MKKLLIAATALLVTTFAHAETARAKVWQTSVADDLMGYYRCTTSRSVGVDDNGSTALAQETFSIRIKRNTPITPSCNGEPDCVANYLVERKNTDGSKMIFYAPMRATYAITYPAGFWKLYPDMSFHTSFTTERSEKPAVLVAQKGTCKETKK